MAVLGITARHRIPVFADERVDDSAFGPDIKPVAGMMIDAAVVEGSDFERPVDMMLKNRATSYLHIHNAKRGCYAARVDRV